MSEPPSRLAGLLARLGLTALFTLAGAAVGLLAGLGFGLIQANDIPPGPGGMAGMTAGVAPILVLAGYVVLGVVGGTIIGLVIGVVSSLLVKRR